MRIEVITDLELIPISKTQWNALVSHSETNTPFQTYEWINAWLSVFRKEYDLLLLFLYHEDTLKGIAPFMIYNHGIHNEIRFVSDVNADYCDVIAGSEDKKPVIKAILEYLFKIKKTWKSIYLKNIPEHSQTFLIMKEIFPHYKLPWLTSTVACPVLKLNTSDSSSQWKTSKTMRRHLNYFSSHGNLSFQIFDSLNEAQGSLDCFFDQHIERWSTSRNSASLFLDSRYKHFYRNLLKEAWPQGWLFFSCLYFNGSPIAFHFGFDYDSKVIWYKPSFDIDYRRRSPGTLLLKFLVEYCQENKKHELDFTLGDESFKRQYTNEVRTNCNVHIFSNRWMYCIHFCFAHLRKTLKRFLKRKQKQSVHISK